ncbi:MAG: hypothetical protein ACQGVC_08590 [Myxococcota bacterium]
MQKIGLALIGVALLVGGFAAGGWYVERQTQPVDESAWTTPKYEKRAHYTPPATPSRLASGAVADEATRAIREALSGEDRLERTEALAEVLRGLAPEQIPSLQPILEDRRQNLTIADYSLLTWAWAQRDAEAALRWAVRSAPASYRLAALVPAMEELAKRDPAVALEVLAEMNVVPNPDGVPAQVALVKGWYDSGIGGLEDYIRQLGIGYDRQRVMGVYARRAILRDGPNPIMAWAQSLPDEDPKFKLTVYRQVGSELAQLEPQAAVAWCEAVCDGEFGTSVRQLIAQRWAAQDGLAAMAWVKRAEPGQERDWAVSGAYRGWWRLRPDEFDAWLLEETQDGEKIEPWLLPVLRVYPAHTAQRNPEKIPQALEWAARLEDPMLRNRAYVSVARVWSKHDPEAAEAWIAQSPLDEEGREAARTLGTRNPYADGGGDAGETGEAEDGGESTTEPVSAGAGAS